jgi:hypothetical protein
MRQHHVAGDKAFVDYSGKRIGIVNPATGEIHSPSLATGVLADALWRRFSSPCSALEPHTNGGNL